MDINTLWSMRLGFTRKQYKKIEHEGLSLFLANSFASKADELIPDFMINQPRTEADFLAYQKSFSDRDEKREEKRKNIYKLREWWIKKMLNEDYPLREKMTLFWHNHYVATVGKVGIPFWVYELNNVLRKNAFGNFRELTKAVLSTNAMIKYLDNTKNKRRNFNENLSRELLELFTLGVGNYSEDDIKSGAKALAGLTTGDKGAVYNKKFQYNETITYLGKTGKFHADDMVEIIFQQQSAPYLITEKILKWFIYDNPPKELVTYYGDYLRSQDFEIKPLLTKIFIEEFNKPSAASKIKDPLTYIMQLTDELNITEQRSALILAFTASQGMELFNQPNVKGWAGGTAWLSSQILLQRNTTADELCKGQNITLRQLERMEADTSNYSQTFPVKIIWTKGNNNEVITQLKDRLIFHADEDMQQDLENILKYDFDPNLKSADDAIMRLFNFIVKTPEFQLI